MLVLSRGAPASASPAAVDASSAAILAAARPRMSAPAPSAAHPAVGQVYAKEGSAIAASQAKMGENSYYYSVGKNKGIPQPVAQASVPQPKAVQTVSAKAQEVTIASYSMIDDDAKVKIHIPMAGASTLADGAIRCVFRDRSFDLKVTAEGKMSRLHIPILLEEVRVAPRLAHPWIALSCPTPHLLHSAPPPPFLVTPYHSQINQHACSCRKRQGKLLLILEKRDPGKQWYELRKTKGIGDSEYAKIVPDSGEAAEFVL